MHPRVLRLRRRVRLGSLLGRRRRVQLLARHLEHLADGLYRVVRRLFNNRRRRSFPSAAAAAAVDAAKLAQQVLHAHVHDLVGDDALQVQLRDQADGAQRALLDESRCARVGRIAALFVGAGGISARAPQLGARRRSPLELLLAGVEQDALEPHRPRVGAGVGSRRELGNAGRQVVAEVRVGRDEGGLRDSRLEDQGDRATEHVGRDGRVVDELGRETVEFFRGELVEDALDGLEGDGGGCGGGRGGGRGCGGRGSRGGGRGGSLRGSPGGASDVGGPDDGRGLSRVVAARSLAGLRLGLLLLLLLMLLASGRGLAPSGGGAPAPPVALLGRSGRPRGGGDGNAGLGRGSRDGASGGSGRSFARIGVVAVDEELRDGLEGRGGRGHAGLFF